MKPDDYAFDFDRIFLGDLPWVFLLEVAMRTAIIYVFALLVVRILGKRGMGQLAPFDFVIIIALGSAVGDPMFYPGLPLLHSMVAITGVVFLTRSLVSVTERSQRVKDFVSSTPTRLVLDGRLDLKGLDAEGIARSELFESLRGAGVQQLGQVERAYLEPGGRITSFLFPPGDIRPGLPLLPDRDARHTECFHQGAAVPDAGNFTCANCGETIWLRRDDVLPACPRCKENEWGRAVYTMDQQLRQSPSDVHGPTSADAGE